MFNPSFTTVRSQVAVVGGCWIVLALFVGELELLQLLPPPGLQVLLLGLTLALLAAFWRLAALQEWVCQLDLRVLLLFHLVRFVGFHFLWLHRRGELPAPFVAAGWGDIGVAATALLVAALPRTNPRRTRAVLVWNTLGLVDILLVVATATRLGLQDPGSLLPLMRLPLSLLPTLVVPLVIATHVIIFVRCFRERRASLPPARVEVANGKLEST